MMLFTRIKVVIIALLFLPMLLARVPVVQAAQCTGQDCLFGQACQQAPTSPACQQAKQQGTQDPVAGPGGLINKTASIIAVIGGIAAVIMIIVGGFNYITAAGNAERAATGRRRILYSLIGIAVIALSYTIVTFISDKIIQ